MLKFHVVFAVWGESYINTMVSLTIPTLLYNGNLPAMAARHDCKVRFFVRAAEEHKIRAAPSVIQLANLVPIEFIHFDPDSAPDVYLAMSDAHHRAGQTAKEEGARVIIASADALFADGSLATVARYAEQGKVAVLCAGTRLVQETAVPALMPRIDSRPLTPRELVRATLDHLHPEIERHFLDSPNFSPFPTLCVWSLGSKGLFFRCFHLHPLMVDFSRIEKLDALKEQSIDGALLGRTLPDWTDIHVEMDSDNILVCTLTSKDVSQVAARSGPFSMDILRETAHAKMVNALHRFFFTKALKLHAEDLDDEWLEVEAATAWIAEAVQSPPLAVEPLFEPHAETRHLATRVGLVRNVGLRLMAIYVAAIRALGWSCVARFGRAPENKS